MTLQQIGATWDWILCPKWAWYGCKTEPTCLKCHVLNCCWTTDYRRAGFQGPVHQVALVRSHMSGSIFFIHIEQTTVRNYAPSTKNNTSCYNRAIIAYHSSYASGISFTSSLLAKFYSLSSQLAIELTSAGWNCFQKLLRDTLTDDKTFMWAARYHKFRGRFFKVFKW